MWNGWGDYARKPELLTFDRAGDAELYGNTVLGLACRYYDFDRFRPLLNEFHRSAQEALYTDIFFLVLEGAVFARGAAERPLLPALRYLTSINCLSLSEIGGFSSALIQ